MEREVIESPRIAYLRQVAERAKRRDPFLVGGRKPSQVEADLILLIAEIDRWRATYAHLDRRHSNLLAWHRVMGETTRPG